MERMPALALLLIELALQKRIRLFSHVSFEPFGCTHSEKTLPQYGAGIITPSPASQILYSSVSIATFALGATARWDGSTSLCRWKY